MASSTLIYYYVFSYVCILHLQSTKGEQTICNTLSCGDIDIDFPFGLKQGNQDKRCSYYPNPSFQLSCDNQSQTILHLPKTRNLIIKNIDYKNQKIQVNDPEGCLPKRFINDWNLVDSPFKLNPEIYTSNIYNLTFLRCPSNITESSSHLPLPTTISCLSDKEHSNLSSVVLVSWAPLIDSTTLSRPYDCEVISTALVPLPWMGMPMWPDLYSDVELVWTEPRCENCAISGQICGFSKDEKTLQLECFHNPTKEGISRSAKYGIAIGVGIPGLLSLIAFSCFICGKFKRTQFHVQRSTNLPSATMSLGLEPLPSFVMGLDRSTIEKYPKTLLGESGRLLKPNDNTCSICLSEYEPKDTLRSIPQCNHYFHAACIDEWLKMNGTCPICRNSPEGYSSTLLPSFSSLSFSLSPLSSSR